MNVLNINIENITENGLLLEFEEKPSRFPTLVDMSKSGEFDFLYPVKTSLKATKIGKLIEIEGAVETTIRLTCHNCLDKFDFSSKNDFSLTFTKEIDDYTDCHGKEGKELSDDDMGLSIFKEDIIDLRDSIQEQVVLSIPFKLLCKKECKGLCIKCGENLNISICDCEHDVTDSRFDILKNLSFE